MKEMYSMFLKMEKA